MASLETTNSAPFGFTRFGKYSSPKAVLIGRHGSKVKLQDSSPGFSFYEQGTVGKDKPHALVLSRPKYSLRGLDPDFRNVFGLTRFGKAWSPTAVLRGRPEVKDISEPGPGAYDLDGCDECRIGISMKGRWLEPDPDDFDSPGPKYALPTLIGKGPAYSLAAKFPDQSSATCSPGPIYMVTPEKPTPKSLTFKPFPLTSMDHDSGPASFDITEPAKKTFRAPPATKFAKKFCSDCEWAPPKDYGVGPGPGAFNLRECTAIGPNPPVAVLTGRPKFRFETSGSGKLVDLTGLTRFGPAGKPGAIIQSQHFPKDKTADQGPLYTIQKPVEELDGTFKSKKIGIKIKSRLKGLELNSAEVPGPGSYNLPGFMGQGPAYSLGPKYRGEQGAVEQFHTVVPSDLAECTPKPTGKAACLKGSLDESKAPDIAKPPPPLQRGPPPKFDCVFDMIPYLEQLCVNY